MGFLNLNRRQSTRQSMSIGINRRQSTSIYVNRRQSTSIDVNLRQSTSIYVNLRQSTRQSTSIDTSIYIESTSIYVESTSIDVNLPRIYVESTSIDANRCQSTPIDVNRRQSTSIYVNLCQSMSKKHISDQNFKKGSFFKNKNPPEASPKVGRMGGDTPKWVEIPSNWWDTLKILSKISSQNWLE